MAQYATIGEVEHYWNSRPCNIKHGTAPVGSLEWSCQVTVRKYFIEPHIPGFAQFERWNGKRVLELGCVDRDTEYLSPSGWCPISNYENGPVMQWWPSGIAEFVIPTAVIKRRQDAFLRLKTKYGIDQMLTDDHRLVCWQLKGANREETMQVVSAKYFADEHERLKNGNKAKFETSFTPRIGTSIPLSDSEIRVQVMFLADGTIPSGNKKCKCSFRKNRKILRARQLLTDACISFTEKSYERNTEFHFHPPMRSKSYSEFWKASWPQLHVIADECVQWDGSISDGRFFSRNKHSADFIHYVFAACGFRSVLSTAKRKSGIDYIVYRISKSKCSMEGRPKTPIKRVASQDGWAYCFAVPSEFLVLRRNGNIFITGNCGIGTDTLQFLRHGAKVVAIDLSKESLKLAIKRARLEVLPSRNWESSEKVQWWVGNAEEWLPRGPFDLAYSFGVLHHTPHPEHALKLIRTRLADDGELRIMLYAKWSIKNLTFRQPEAQAGCPIARHYSAREARKLLESCGFDIVSIKKAHIFPWKVSEYIQYRYVKHWPYRWMSGWMFSFLEKIAGNHLLIVAKKWSRL